MLTFLVLWSTMHSYEGRTLFADPNVQYHGNETSHSPSVPNALGIIKAPARHPKRFI